MPSAFEIVDGCTQADAVGDVGRARLELVGDVVPLALAQVDALDHVAAAQEGGHGLQDLLARPQHADAGRPQHLVAGKGQKISAQGLHVHRQVGHALRAIDQAAARPPRALAAQSSATGLMVPSTLDMPLMPTSLTRSPNSVQQPVQILQEQAPLRDPAR